MSLNRAIKAGLYGAMAVAGSSVAAGGEQILTVSGLSSLADGAYIVDVNIKNNSGGTRSVHLVVNGDTTVTNYYRQIDFVDNATPTPLRQNNNHFYSGVTNGQCMMAFGVLRVSRNNLAYFSGDVTGEAPSGVTRGDITIAYNTTIAGGITSLAVRMDAAGFTAGDYIKVYKIGAPNQRGAQIGYAKTESTTVASDAGTPIPIDNTIPQSSEGVAFASLDTTYTVKDANSLLEVEVTLPIVTQTTTGSPRFALFRDAGADAIAANFVTVPSSDYCYTNTLRVVVPASAVGATTFKLRWSCSGGTAYINRAVSVAALFNGMCKATMTVKEIQQ